MKTEQQQIKRLDDIRRFLATAGMDKAIRTPIPGDASFRRYERLSLDNQNYILMDAPPPQEDVRPFVRVQKILLQHGYSAPKLLAEDSSCGLLLLEDLGDSIYSRLLKSATQDEEKFYHAAVALIADMTKRQLPDNIPPYDNALLTKELGLFTDWFLPAAIGKLTDESIAEFWKIWRDAMPAAHAISATLVLRDYHADNLLWLPERDGIKKVGLLDFQDAVIGSPAYDIVSLLEDARRDVSEATVKSSLQYFFSLCPQINQSDFMNAYAVLGAQRNLKIIGIFTRLCLRDGKPKYLSLLPRVWQHLENDLRHPSLLPLKQWLDRNVPNSSRNDKPI